MNDHADDNELFKKLIQKPRIAWPTVALLIAAFAIIGLSTFAYVQGALPLAWAMLFNSIASYMSFTVAHDATHSALFANRRMNDWAGRLAMLLLEPGPFFQVFRFIHMKHHRFTNDPEKDPDVYSGTGSKWLLPFKWLTLDYIYFKTYLSSDVFKKRPKSERREFYFAVLFAVIVVTAATLAGFLHYYLLLFFIPTRIAKYIIVMTFDFLPHHPHAVTVKEAPYRATSNRVGMEWLLTPLFVYQNYHLVHHLYPAVPFYRNIKIWNARKGYHEAQNPAIVDTFSLSPR
jgi:fatty acid desaturase